MNCLSCVHFRENAVAQLWMENHQIGDEASFEEWCDQGYKIKMSVQVNKSETIFGDVVKSLEYSSVKATVDPYGKATPRDAIVCPLFCK